MLSHLRLRTAAALLAVAFLITACGEEKPLPTTVDPVAVEADIAAAEAALDVPEINAFASMGLAIDDALAAAGGATVLYHLPAAMVTEGPRRPLERWRARVMEQPMGEDATAIPLAALGKTFTYNPIAEEYEISGLPGAPAGGVRFILYAVDANGDIVDPLDDIGYVDFVNSSTATTRVGSAKVYATGGVQVMEYVVTVAGTEALPAISVEGFVGTGINRLTFNLALGLSLASGNATINWRTEIPGRGLATRVQLGIGDHGFTIGSLMRNGLRRIEIGGTIAYATGGTLTVRIGHKVFAKIHLDEFGDGVIEDADGNPLSAEQEDMLWAVFDWFASAFDVADVLLGPLYTLLDLDFGEA